MRLWIGISGTTRAAFPQDGQKLAWSLNFVPQRSQNIGLSSKADTRRPPGLFHTSFFLLTAVAGPPYIGNQLVTD